MEIIILNVPGGRTSDGEVALEGSVSSVASAVGPIRRILKDHDGGVHTRIRSTTEVRAPIRRPFVVIYDDPAPTIQVNSRIEPIIIDTDRVRSLTGIGPTYPNLLEAIRDIV